jgi:hypothetical protein
VWLSLEVPRLKSKKVTAGNASVPRRVSVVAIIIIGTCDHTLFIIHPMGCSDGIEHKGLQWVTQKKNFASRRNIVLMQHIFVHKSYQSGSPSFLFFSFISSIASIYVLVLTKEKN